MRREKNGRKSWGSSACGEKGEEEGHGREERRGAWGEAEESMGRAKTGVEMRGGRLQRERTAEKTMLSVEQFLRVGPLPYPTLIVQLFYPAYLPFWPSSHLNPPFNFEVLLLLLFVVFLKALNFRKYKKTKN